MAKPTKSARETLERGQGLPKVVDDPRGRGRMLIPKPLDVDALVRKIHQGKLATEGQIRERLARDFGADLTCPLTTGIFLRIAAEAAEEDANRGGKDITPYWRVIKSDGSLNEKFPGGVEAQACRLRDEGHTVEPAPGKTKPRVADFARSLQAL
jgi:hypothetical protein